MTEITDGFTSISAGSDSVEGSGEDFPHGSVRASRAPTGARVVLEFRREQSLAPAQWVRVRYDFAGDGILREGEGIASQIRTVVRPGHAVVYHYRVSYWIAADALLDFAPDNVRYRTEQMLTAECRGAAANALKPGLAAGVPATDPSPA